MFPIPCCGRRAVDLTLRPSLRAFCSAGCRASGATSLSMTVQPRAVQDFTTATFRRDIVHDDRFQLPYVGGDCIVKEVTMDVRRAMRSPKGKSPR